MFWVLFAILALVLALFAVAAAYFRWLGSDVGADSPTTPAAESKVIFHRRPRAGFNRRAPRAPATEAQMIERPSTNVRTILQPTGGENGIRRQALNFNLDTLCRLTGRSKRDCGCIRCQDERSRFGN